MAQSWKVSVDFTEADTPEGEENWDTVEVEANTEELAKEKALTKIEAMYDVEEILKVEINWCG